MSEQHEHPHDEAELTEVLHEHDEWFRHAPDEPHHQQGHGDFNPYVVLAFLLVTVAVVIGVTALVIPWFGREVRGRVAQVREQNEGYTAELRGKEEAWNARLYGAPDWIDEQAGTIRVPIDMAMELVARDYAESGR